MGTTAETKRAYRRRGAKRDPFKRAKFVEEMSRPGVTQAEAALAAGYSDTYECAKVRGSQLMSDPSIRAEVEQAALDRRAVARSYGAALGLAVFERLGKCLAQEVERAGGFGREMQSFSVHFL